MKGTSPFLVFAAYLATLLLFETVVSSSIAVTGISIYRSEKISLLLAAILLIATCRLHFDSRQPSINFSTPSTASFQEAAIASVLLWFTGIALIGVQVFLTAQFSEQRAAELWDFTGQPGALGLYDKYFGSKSGLVNLVLFASTQFIVVPLAEEIYFKGLILEKLLWKYSGSTSILITSTLFAIAHDSRMFISVFAFSVFTCIYYQRRRNIWILASIHGFGNFFDWLYSGFGGITFLEAKRIDQLSLFSTWRIDIAVATVSCSACSYFLIRLSRPTPPSP
jgi:membrane protease YdiL (CAAX protease family)